MAESVLPLLRCPFRAQPALGGRPAVIEATMPNRLAYFDGQGLDWCPYRPTTPVPVLPAAAAFVRAALLAGRALRGRS